VKSYLFLIRALSFGIATRRLHLQGASHLLCLRLRLSPSNFCAHLGELVVDGTILVVLGNEGRTESLLSARSIDLHHLLEYLARIFLALLMSPKVEVQPQLRRRCRPDRRFQPQVPHHCLAVMLSVLG
jgi:hypothetical protein